MNNCTQINVIVTGQSIQLANNPVIASGGVNSVEINFVFCGQWDGLGKTAVFYRDAQTPYKVVLVEDSALVPTEILAESGSFKFGVYGTDGDRVFPSILVSMAVAEGSAALHAVDPEESAPDIYNQLLAAYGKQEAALAVEKARINELVALRGSGTVTEYPLSGKNGMIGTIKTNGFFATIYIETAYLEWGLNTYTAFVPAAVAPMGTVKLECETEKVNIGISPPVDELDGASTMTIYCTANAEGGPYEELVEARATYQLANIAIPEVSDIRVGLDGTVYPTAGDAVRLGMKKHTQEQIEKTEAKDVVIQFNEELDAWEPGLGYSQLRSRYLHNGLRTLRLRNDAEGYECTATKIELTKNELTGDEDIDIHTAMGVFRYTADGVFSKIADSESGGGGGDCTDCVKSVNGIAPDKNGNVEVETGGMTEEQAAQLEALDEAVFRLEFDTINKFNPHTVTAETLPVGDRYVSAVIPCKVGDVLRIYKKDKTANDEPTAYSETFGVILVDSSGKTQATTYSTWASYTVPAHTSTPNLIGVKVIPAWLKPAEHGLDDLKNVMLTINMDSVNGVVDAFRPFDDSGVKVNRIDALEEGIDMEVPQQVTFIDYYHLYANAAYPATYGNTYGGAGWCYTDYVSCAGAKGINILTCGNGSNSQRGLVFYDADKTPVRGHVFTTGEDETVTHDATYPVPENAAFFRTTINMEHKPNFYANLIVNMHISDSIKAEIARAKQVESAIIERIDTLHTMANKKVLIIGDSISTGNTSTGINYGNYEKWVDKLIKQGFLSTDNVTNDSIHATGFVASLSGDGTDCFLPRLQAVQNPGEYDIVIIFGGINDFIKAINFDTFSGAVDAFFEYLTNTFINARICVLRPLRTSNTDSAYGKNQQEYSAYIGEVAKSYCLPVLNLTEESGFYPWIPAFKNRWTFTGWTGGDGTSGDGVHPNEEWEETRLVPMVKAFLKSLIE